MITSACTHRTKSGQQCQRRSVVTSNDGQNRYCSQHAIEKCSSTLSVPSATANTRTRTLATGGDAKAKPAVVRASKYDTEQGSCPRLAKAIAKPGKAQKQLAAKQTVKKLQKLYMEGSRPRAAGACPVVQQQTLLSPTMTVVAPTLATTPIDPSQLLTFSKRYTLAEALNEGVVISDPCDVSKALKQIKRVGNPGASETLLMFAKLVYKFSDRAEWRETETGRQYLQYWKQRLKKADDEVVLKASFQVKRPDLDNSLLVEIAVYERFIYRLLNWNATPNVMMMIRYYVCKDFFTQSLPKQPQTIQKYFRQLYTSLSSGSGQHPDLYDFDTVNMLLLERGRGSSFSEWLDKQTRSEEEWFSVLFQIVYTLECFNQVGLRHNDLHLKNIWIEHPVAPQKWIYFVQPSVYFVVPVTAVVKIYDFDRSFAWKESTDVRTGKTDAQLINTGLDLRGPQSGTSQCDYGQCNIKSEQNDLFNVLYLLYWKFRGENKNPKSVRTWIKQWFYGKNTLLDKEYPWAGQYCITAQNWTEDQPCTAQGEPEPGKEMVPVLQGLEQFPKFRGNLPLYDLQYLPDKYPNVFALPHITQTPAIYLAWQQALLPTNIRPVNF